MGAPGPGGTWLDESINKDLKAIMEAAHRLNWHRRVLLEFRSCKRSRD